MNPVKISTELLSTKQEKEAQPQQDGGKAINDKVEVFNVPQSSSSIKKTSKRSLSQLRGFRPAAGQIIQVNNLALFPSDEAFASTSSIHELKPQIMQSSSGQNTPASAAIEEECEVIYPVNLSHRFKPQAKRKQSYNQLKASAANPTVSASKQPQVVRFGSQNGITPPPLNIQNILQNEFLSNYQQINSHRSTSKPHQSSNDLSASTENINDSFPMTARDSSFDQRSIKKENDYFQKLCKNNNLVLPNNINKAPNNNLNAETAQFRNTVAKLLSRKSSQHSPYYPHSQLDQKQQKSLSKPSFEDPLDSASHSCQLYSARSTSATKVSSSKRGLLPLRKESSTFLPPLQDSTNFDRSTSSSVQEDNIQSAPLLQDNLESNEGENSKLFRDFKTPNQYKNSKVNICSVSADKVKGSNWERSGGNNRIIKSNSVSRGSQCPSSFSGKEGVVLGQSYLNYNSTIATVAQSEEMRNGQQLNQTSTGNNTAVKAADSANSILQNVLKKGGMQSSHKKNEPKVLSPSGLKNQKVFRIPHHLDGRSNSCNPQNKANFSHLNNSTNSFVINQAIQAATASVNNKNQPGQSQQQHFNFISNGFYPLLSEKKQSRYQNSNNTNMPQINEILDQSVEEFLEYKQLPAIEPSKTSKKQIGVISAFAANTHMGTVRNYNEDRVSIILNIAKPKNKPDELIWPSASFFAIYDGHGGNSCAEFLKENLHHYIVKDDSYPGDPKTAIENGFAQIEKDFLEIADKQQPFDRSGSCAIVALIVERRIYVGNVGDSRAVLSSNLGNICLDLSEDHKPSLPSEEQRIRQFGGHVYRSIVPIYQNHSTFSEDLPSMHGNANGQNKPPQAQEYIKGPPRAFPGRLSVSRTIGDAEAKLSQYGGIQGVISPEPEIKIKDIEEDDDFLILGCDGIFDKLSSQEAIQACWAAANDGNKNPHEFSGKAIEDLLRLSMAKNSYDNVTAVMIGLNNVKKCFETKS